MIAFLIWLRRKRRQCVTDNKGLKKKETRVKCDDSGGSEGEVTILDLTALNVPPVSVVANGGNFIPRTEGDLPTSGDITTVDVVVCRHSEKLAKPPHSTNWDDLRNYAYEGGGSAAHSLSSLGSGSGSDSNEQNFDCLRTWGPRFAHLSSLYSGDSEKEEEDPS